MRFQAPQLGALGVTFTGLRLMQCASLIAIIGMLAKFIDEIVTSQRAVPDLMVGTLSVVSFAPLPFVARLTLTSRNRPASQSSMP
jgi:hypothetical protein